MEIDIRIALLWRLCLPTAVLLAIAACSAAQDSALDDALAHAKLTYSQQGAKAALPEFEQVLESYRKAGDHRGEAVTTGLIGNCYKRLGDYAKALSLLDSALEMKRELHDRAEEGKTLSHLGLVYWEQGEYSKAIEAFNQSIAIAREVQDTKLEAASLNNLSLVYDEQGAYRRSLDQYQRALALHRSVNYEPGVSDTLGNIGGVYLLLGRYSEAERYYREALEISRRLELKPSEAQDLGNIAQCLLGQGKIQESLQTYDQAIALAKNAGLAKEEADWYRGKASALWRIGKFDEALRHYQFSGETYSKAGLKRERVENLGDVGNAHLELGDRKGAEKSFQEAIAISRGIGHQRGMVVNRLALAETRRLSGEFLEAQKDTEAALAQARKIDDSTEIVKGLLLLGRILQDRREIRTALQKTVEARELANQSELRLLEGEALDQIGELELGLHQPISALTHLETAREIATQSGAADLLWKAEFHRGQALERLSRNEEALQAYRAAVDSIESVRAKISQQSFRTGYFQDKQRVYVALVQLLLRMGKTGEAFDCSERLREYSYQNLSNRPFAIEYTPGLSEARSRVVHVQEMLNSENDRPVAQQRAEALQVWSEELRDAQRSYELSLQDSDTRLPKMARANATELARILPHEAILLEYVVADDQLVIFAVTASELRAITVPVRARDLRSKIELFRDLVAEPGEDRWRKPAQSLYSLLISPIERKKLFKGVHSLVIIPHGILNYLPFAALPENANGHTAFLIEKYEITELPSASLLTMPATGRTGAPERVVSFAPSRSGLKFAIPEAQNIAGIFGANGAAVTGHNATKGQFKDTAPQYDIVHVATHGFFNKINPMLSGLQLEPDASSDGRLEVHEILKMRFNAQLVTLSACDTALGSSNFAEIPAGDEFVGLNRAFLESGSDAVIASIWKVGDRSTLVMMGDVYRRIRREGGAKALADAQRAMIRSPYYASPYYWAPFVFMGRSLGSSSISAEKN
jgi:CHAT domain-containing protein/Tfp pilus assembly protein PilF